MGKSKAPAPPDPRQTAGAQTATNIGTAIANNNMQMVDQNTPYGSLKYDQTGAYQYVDPNTGASHWIPKYTATTSLSPNEQYKLEQGQAAEKSLADVAAERADFLKGHFSDGIDAGGLPQAGVAEDLDYSEDRQRVEDALMERLNPYLERDREAMRTGLVNQGITLGSEAYNRASDDFNRGANDARLGAILSAGDEQNRLAGLDMQQFNMQNTARQQALQEQFAMRNQPINEITALLSGSQVSMPNVTPQTPQGAATTDVAGLINSNYNQRLNAWQTNQNQRGSLMGGLFGAAGQLGSAALLSDRRLKADVAKVGEANGISVYRYRYLGGVVPHVGVMADEVAHIPGAVIWADGFASVDYGKVMEAV